ALLQSFRCIALRFRAISAATSTAGQFTDRSPPFDLQRFPKRVIAAILPELNQLATPAGGSSGPGTSPALSGSGGGVSGCRSPHSPSQNRGLVEACPSTRLLSFSASRVERFTTSFARVG